MRVVERDTLDGLVRDMRKLPARAERLFSTTTRKNTRAGMRMAKANARESSGGHGVHYPDRIDMEMLTSTTGVYGPHGRPQGEMSFEEGSENQEGHQDLARSADVAGPRFARDIRADLGKLFW